MNVNKGSVNESFSEAVNTYDLWARHQRLTANKLVCLLPKAEFKHILDAGCGTGLLTRAACEYYPQAKFLGVDMSEKMISYCRTSFSQKENMHFAICDLEELNDINPYMPFDLIVSSFVLQWISSIDSLLKNLINALIPGGYLGIAVPVSGSLFELHDSFSSVFKSNILGLTYRNYDYYVSTFRQQGFSICTSEVEDLCIFLDRVDLLRYFKYTGANFRHNPLYYPKTIKEINTLFKYYEENYSDSRKLFPVTFKILFIIARK